MIIQTLFTVELNSRYYQFRSGFKGLKRVNYVINILYKYLNDMYTIIQNCMGLRFYANQGLFIKKYSKTLILQNIISN